MKKRLTSFKQAQRGLTDDRSYWIGGSAGADSFSPFGLENYTGGDAGKILVLRIKVENLFYFLLIINNCSKDI